MINAWIPSHIQVTIHQGRDLALKSKNSNSEVYVTVQVEKEKELTTLVPRQVYPKWNQTFLIPLMSLDSSVDITVRQKSKFTDDYIGCLHIPFTNLSISKKLTQNWYKLGPRQGKVSSKIRGDLLVTTSFLANWDSNSTEHQTLYNDFTDTLNTKIDLEQQGSKMLRRSKSEYKGRPSKDSPKLDRSTKKGLFSRSLRKKNPQVFEDCEDEFVSLSIDGQPPTPPKSEQRKLYNEKTEISFNDSLIYTEFAHSNDIQSSMFTEAAQLERNGVIDLQRVDPVTRVEQGKRRFLDEMNKGGGSRPSFKPVSSSQITKPNRPVSMFTTPKELPHNFAQNKSTSFDSSFEDDHNQSCVTTPTTSTSTLPDCSQMVTYRAISTPRRREKINECSERGLLNHQTSNTSIESVTSEYYSNAGSVNNITDTNNIVSIATEDNNSIEMKKKLEQCTKNDRSDPVQRTLNTETGELCRHGDNKKESLNHLPATSRQHRKLKRGATTDGSYPSYSHTSLPRRHSGAAASHRLSPKDRTDAQQKVQYRQKGVATSTAGGRKGNRHSADVAQLVKLSNLSEDKNDGLANVLSTDKLRQLLAKTQQDSNSSSDKTPPVSKGDKTPPTSKEPTITESPPLSLSQQSPPMETAIKPTTEEIKDMAASDTYDCSSNTSIVPSSLDNSISSDTQETVIVPTKDSFVSIAVQNASSCSSRSSTPSQVSPPLSSTDVTRETTPSPEHCEEEIDGPVSKEEVETTPKARRKVKHTVEVKKLDGKTGNFQPISPLPPSISNTTPSKHNNLPAQRHHSNSAADLTLLMKQYPPSMPNDVTNLYWRRPSSSQCSYPPSSTSSGRSSPIIKEEDENTTPLSTPPSATHLPAAAPVAVTTSPAKGSGTKFTYESASLPRRGGGIRRAITMYQDNKKQVAKVKQQQNQSNLERKRSFTQQLKNETSSNIESAASTENSPKLKEKQHQGSGSSPSLVKSSLIQQRSFERHEVSSDIISPTSANSKGQSLGASFTAVNSANCTKDTSLKSHETHHSVHSQTNSIESSTPGTPPSSGHFALPPPPVVEHSYIAGQVSGMLDNESQSSSANSDITSSSSEYEEDFTHETLQGWSKETLISELLRANHKVKTAKQELRDTKTYLESLLVKVMENSPDLLLSS